MKKRNVVIGILIIAFAIFGILEVSGVISPIESVIGELSVFKVFALMVLTVLIVISISRRHILPVVLQFSCVFMVVEQNIAYMCGIESGNIINNWALLAFTVAICVGLAFILPKRHGKLAFSYDSESDDSKNHHTHHGRNSRSHQLGSYTEYIDCAAFTKRRIENNLGRTSVRFENVSEYVSGAELYIENNLGGVDIYVPSSWRVLVSIENNLGGVNDKSNKDTDGPKLFIRGENNLGGIDIISVQM